RNDGLVRKGLQELDLALAVWLHVRSGDTNRSNHHAFSSHGHNESALVRCRDYEGIAVSRELWIDRHITSVHDPIFDDRQANNVVGTRGRGIKSSQHLAAF